ncbi:MAG: metal-dependent hydrolase [Cyclobacteriaceae bacterium]
MKITYYGHNCFLFESDTRFLSDPFITKNPLAAAMNVDNIKTDHILLTHGHGDHIADLRQIASNNDAQIIAMVEVAQWFESSGQANTNGINFGGTVKLTNTTSVKYVQAHHSSSLPDGSYGGNPGSFIIKSEGKTIFLAGDTSLHYDMKMFGELYRFDIAILPIGGHYTMDFYDATHAARYLKVHRVIGCHYDSFPAIKIDHAVAMKTFEEANLELILPEIEQSINL